MPMHGGGLPCCCEREGHCYYGRMHLRGHTLASHKFAELLIPMHDVGDSPFMRGLDRYRSNWWGCLFASILMPWKCPC